MTHILKTTLFSLIALCLACAEAARFDVVNQCSYTVWPAGLPNIGGRQLNSGETWALDVPAGTASGRIWGRTGCTFDGSGRGTCQTGDCGGVLNCQLSGQPPTTLAEFTLNGGNNLDSYNLSVIDGFNIPMSFSPTSNGCNNGVTCTSASCPDAYQYPEDNSKVRSCPAGTNYRIVFCPA